MPRNVYSEINLHITWHTKKRAAVIVDGIERQLFQFIQHKIAETSGVELHAIGGTADHVHLAVSVPPTLNISEWIGQIKGASTHYANHRIANRRVLEWQTGYGVVSFDQADVGQAAQQIIQPDNMVWIVVGDRAKIESGPRELGFSEIRLIDADGRPAD